MTIELVLTANPVVEAAVYGALIIHDRPFPENNREIGYEVMRQMLRDAGLPWPDQEAAEIEAMLADVEAGRTGVPEFVEWVRRRVATA